MNTTTPKIDKITVGKLYFVRTASLLTDSLFNAGGTASGTFKRMKGGVLFSKPTGEPFAFLVMNRHRERFFVTCSQQDDGRIRYMYALADWSEKALGVDGMGYGQLSEEAKRVAAQFE